MPVAEKPDSQEICFVPNGDYAAFIDAYFREQGIAPDATRGEIVDTDGHVLGEHAGVHHFTVGQRRGLRIAAGEPLYVIATEPASQRVIVGRNDDLLRARLVAKDVNWISIAAHRRAGARPGQDSQQALPRLWRRSIRPTDPARVEVHFDEPQRAVTPGQGAVFYRWRSGARRRVDRIAVIQYLIARFVLWSLAHSPPALARFYARLLDLALPRLRRVAMRNLELAYPEKTPAERTAIVDEVFRSIARLLYAFARFPHMNAREHFRMDSLRRAGAFHCTPRRPATASCSPPRTWAIGSSAPSPTA